MRGADLENINIQIGAGLKKHQHMKWGRPAKITTYRGADLENWPTLAAGLEDIL